MDSRFISANDLPSYKLLSEYLLPQCPLLFNIPNFSILTKERVQRNNLFLKGIHTECGLKNCKPITSKELAAIKIQKVYRGYVGRKKYFDILYESFQKSENISKQYHEQFAIESEALIDSYRMERELEDYDVIERNKLRFLNAKASIIQRVWRKRTRLVKKEHICCFCKDEYYPNLYEYYSTTKIICFCCEKHKIFQKETDFSSTSATMIDDNFFVYNADLREGTCDKNATENSFSQVLDVSNNNLGENDKLNNCLKEEYSSKTFMLTPILKCDEEMQRKKCEYLNILQTLKEKNNLNFTNNECFHIENLSLLDLHWIIDHLEQEVSNQSIILVNHLMIRDDLYTKHDFLLKGLDKLKKM